MAPLRSVLLVDDNKDDNNIHRIWLQRCGVVSDPGDILIKQNGLEALQFLEQWETNRQTMGDRFPPTLILLDINMPVMDGFGFLEALERLASRVEINSIVLLMLTSSNNPHDRERARSFQLVKGYIEKPLNRKKIRELLDEHFTA